MKNIKTPPDIRDNKLTWCLYLLNVTKETEQVCEVISGVLLIHQKVVPSQEVVFVGVFVKQLDLQILSRVVVY